MGGAFSWSDSPRHALNGAFVLDMIKAMPFGDPVGYAYNYYSQYPALTILFYPPLLSFLLAPFYAVFGVSQETALIVLFICYCFFSCGTYFIARQWFGRIISLGIAVTFSSMPEIAFWGRQVMLEIPSFAFLVWSMFFMVRYIRTNSILFLYVSIALLVLASYTKLSVVFVVVPYLIVLIQHRGTSLFRDKHSYFIASIATVGMIPLIFLTLKFGQANIQSATGISDSIVSRVSLEGWIWYALKIPSQVGWPALVAILTSAFIFLFLEKEKRQLVNRNLLLISWFIIGYIFFSSIALKEARHSIFILLPLGLFIGYTCNFLNQKKYWLGNIFIGTVAISTLTLTVISRPVHYVDGYKDVVKFVSNIAPENSNILFSGYRDGAFIFNMRAYSNRPDISVIRADKLLLSISVRRELGVEQQKYDRAEISSLINKLAVHYVVAQPDFWTDLEQMKLLQSLLQSGQFKEIKRFTMKANYNAHEKELVLYKNLGDVANGPVTITNELPIINQTITGTNKTSD